MSDATVTAPAAASTSFLGDSTPTNAAPVTAAEGSPSSFFRDEFQKEGQFVEGWAKSFEDKGMTRVANAAMKYKTEEEFFRGMDHALGVVGRKSAVGYPGDDWTDNDRAEFRRVAGIPDSPEGYELEPKEKIDGLDFNKENIKKYTDWAHKNHVPKSAMQELLANHLEAAKGQVAAQKAAYDHQLSEGALACSKAFREEWGDDYDIRREANSQFAQSQGLDLSDPAIAMALSNPSIVRMVDMARSALRGGNLPGMGGEHSPGSGSMNAEQQLQKFMEANPDWAQNSTKAERVHQLSAYVATQRKRG